MTRSAHHPSLLGLCDAEDETIFRAAKEANAIVMTKDTDFLELQFRFGAPPQIILIALGNTSNQKMRDVLQAQFNVIREFLLNGEPIIEINDRRNKE